MRTIRPPTGGWTGLTVDEFNSSPSDDCRLVCLTSRDVTVIRKGLEQFYWPTRYGEWIAPNKWELAANRPVIQLLEELEVKLMACGIEEGLESVAAAIVEASNASAIGELANAVELLAKKPCCESNVQQVVTVNGGINGSTNDGYPTYGTVPVLDTPTTIPDGYEDEAHFDRQLCARAAAMVDGAIIGFGVWLGIDSLGAVGTTIALSLGFMGIITIPEVMIPALISCVAIAWLASGTIYAVRLELIAHRQDLICILYKGGTASAVTEALAELFDIIIAAASVTGPVAVAMKTILLILFSADTINKLYDAFAGTNYAEADCSDCEEEVECGDAGTPSHQGEFSSASDGYLSYSNNVLNLNGTVDTQTGYRYSGWFGGTWLQVPYPARQAVSVDCSEGLDGTTDNGYFSMYRPDGSAFTLGEVGALGSQHLEDINDYLAANPTCISVVVFSYATEPSYVDVTFSD